MTTIGNCFALLILVILAIMFFSNRHYLTRARGYFLVTLILAFASIVVDIFKAELFAFHKVSPVWAKIVASVDYSIILLTTSFLALYLIAKICEHSTNENNFFYAKLAIAVIFSLLCLALILNIPFGFIFDASKDDAYIAGAVYYLPYLTLIPQVLVVIAYAFKYHRTTSKTVNHSLAEGILSVALCIAIKMFYRDISASIISIVLIELIFFLNFQNFKLGVNSLTNLSGERAFMKELSTRIEKKSPFKVFLIHINNLSSIKRAYGHKTGNELLWHFAHGLDREFVYARAFNLYAAIFALVMPVTDSKSEDTVDALFFMERGVEVDDMLIKPNYTVAELVWSGEENAELIYEKLEYAIEVTRGANLKYEKCSDALDAARMRRKLLIERTKVISREAGFEVWYQPIYSVRKGEFSSMEALIRLKEKDGSYISPAEFIPLAENTGQIVPLTWFVIEESCRALATEPELHGIRVSINLPMMQLSDPYFETKLNKIVDRYNISHDQISFEFTERTIMNDLSMAEKNMRRLSRSGYTFYLDDFGTGYSNFECVLKLPLKTIKLDMSLTSTAEALKSNYGLVKVLTSLFHKMGLNVVAEGAETDEQIEILKDYKVDGIQGYYYTKPLPLEKVVDFLKKSKK